MARIYRRSSHGHMPIFLLAGLVGGIAEIFFIAAYSQIMPIELGHVAREITASFSRELAGVAVGAVIGLGIHLLLSLLIGAGASVVLGRWKAWHEALSVRFGLSVSALLAIWGFNFFILLPKMNPAFVSILPLSVTFISKALFGLAMWATLEYVVVYPAYKYKPLAGVGVQHEQFEQAAV